MVEQGPEPIHPWIEAEAHGDDQLRRLLLLREAVFDGALAEGTNQRSNPEAALSLRIIGQQITERQQALGINPEEHVYEYPPNADEHMIEPPTST